MALVTIAAHHQGTRAVRYVWVSRPVLHAEPDGKNANLEHLLYGAKVKLQVESVDPTRHREIIAKLRAGGSHAASDVTHIACLRIGEIGSIICNASFSLADAA